MAKGKNLTFKMKKYVGGKMKLDYEEWMYLRNTQDEFVIKNKNTGEVKTIDKKERNITSF